MNAVAISQIDPTRIVDIMSEVIKAPHQLVEGEMPLRKFLITQFPSESTSHDEPPVRISKKTEQIPIDGVLGTYDPIKRAITIYEKGIGDVSALLQVKVDDLKYVVRIHEWAHAIVHLGFLADERIKLLRDDSNWMDAQERATLWFQKLEPALHEKLAQMLTFYVLRSLEEDARLEESKLVIRRIRTVFDRLTARAPSEYQISHLVLAPRSRLPEGVELLKSNTLLGLQAWEKVMTW